MKFRCLVIALALSGAFALDYSWGQASESPPQAKAEQKPNDTPATNPDAKTQNSKIEIAPIPDPAPSPNQSEDKPATEAPQNSNEVSEGTEYWVYRGYKVKITDGLLVLFTLALVVIGTFQAIYLGGTLTATTVAAIAAKEAAESLPTLERAYVFLGQKVTGVLQRDSRITHGEEVRSMRTTVEFFFKNHGRTPAILRGVSAVVAYVASTDKSSRQNILLIGGGFPVGIIVSAGEPSVPLQRPCIIPVPDYEKAERGEGYILFWGEIQYDDIFGKTRTTGFACEYNFRGGNWVPTHAEDLGYFT
jgi:hypothetical protein